MTKLKIPQARNVFPLNFIVTFFGFLDTHLLIPIMALYAWNLGAGVGMIGLIVGLYSIANTPANILFGRVVDRVGYKHPLIIGLLGDALAMCFYAICRLPFHLALVRLFHGVSGGMVGPATMSVTAEQAAYGQRGRAMSFYGMAMGMATLVGYGLSGVMASRLGYGFVFYFGSAALLLGVLLAIVMPRVKAPAAALKTSLSHDMKKIGGLLRRRGLVTSYCSIFAQYFAFGGVVTLLPLYVKGLGMEAFHVGMLLATFAIVFTLLQFFGGAIADRVGRQIPITSGLGLCVVSLVAMPALGTFALLAVIMALYGAAYALLFPSISALVADYTMPEERGRATGIFHSLLTAGVAIGAPLMGWVAHFVGIELGLALCSSAAALALIIAWVDLRKMNPGQDILVV
jgi:MFS family permease